MKRDSDCPHLVRWTENDPYILEPCDVGRKFPECSTVKVIEPQHVGRYVWYRHGKAWIESEAEHQQRTTAGGDTRYFDTVYKFNGALERRTVDGYTFRQAVLHESKA